MKPQRGEAIYWRSLGELAGTPEFRAFLEAEFPQPADRPDGPTRRRMLQIMAASLALAGASGCRRWPEEKLVPYAHRPPGRVPGRTERYATAMELGGVAQPLLVTCYDGRPIKVEGNLEHPAGAPAGVFAQACVLDLYDPHRSRFPTRRVEGVAGRREARRHEDFEAFCRPHFAALRTAGGAGLAFLGRETSSPSVAAMRTRIQEAFPQARWHVWESLNRDHEREGARRAFGRVLRTQLRLDQADVIACFDADILGQHPDASRHARDWAAGRRSADQGRMNRLHVIESGYSLTGAAADHRLPASPRDIALLVAALAGRLGVPGAEAPPGMHPGEQAAWIERLAADLGAHPGRAVVAAGPSLPPEVHVLCHAINARLDAVGRTIVLIEDPCAESSSQTGSLRSLVEAMNSGQVGTLVILGGNPVYDAPADLDFPAALARVATSIHLGVYEDETALGCRWHLPQAHDLESWGDARTWDGTITSLQPMIRPLYDGRTVIELLALLLEDPADGPEIVRRTFATLLPAGDFESAWRRVLHDGFLDGSASRPVEAAASSEAVAAALRELRGVSVEPGANPAATTVVFRGDARVHDGRFAHNAWLQETPDPMSTLTWDNAAMISVADAARLGIAQGDVVAIRCGGATLEIPACVMPGQPAGVVALALGGGRTAAGPVGSGVGADAGRLRTCGGLWSAAAEISRTGRTHRLALTQDHHAIDRLGAAERERRVGTLVREGVLEEYAADPQFARKAAHAVPDVRLWEDPAAYDGHRWGMVIDLNVCIGCNACAIACQAENNVPVVGRDEVLRGREMHWLRVDRYFRGDPAAPSPPVVHQPLTCHHCENAPCEQVCPVAATVHDTEGLNTMVYNRCIGTRYCSNNCPFKVRRYNWLDYHSKPPRSGPRPWFGMPDSQQKAEIDDVRKLGFNPDVTVRMRGVMEKCTFCVQRIQAARIAARRQQRGLTDGEVIPACAQACPTQAIVFGDLNDPASRVRALQDHPRAYTLLDELNLRVRTRYLAKVRHPLPTDAPAGHGAIKEHA